MDFRSINGAGILFGSDKGRFRESLHVLASVALALSGDLIDEQPPRAHPVPAARGTDDSQLIKRSALVSVAFHIILIAIGVIITNWPVSGITGTPQEEIMDVTIVPLSALDTLLPKGAPQQPSPPAELPPVKQEIQQKPLLRANAEPVKKIVAARSMDSVRATPVEQRSSEASDASPNSNDQPLGVSNGQAHSVEQARISYQDMVATMLARAKKYPERALKRRMTGDGTIRIEISSDGSLSGFQIVRSTELPILDEELRAMVDRAAPFPAFPSDLHKQSLALLVPVAFRLQS
jgi:protein TonB